MSEPHPLNIVFMGSPDFAVPALEAIYNSHHKLMAVVTVPDKPHGRGRKMRGSAIQQKARELGVPILQPERLRDPAFEAQMKTLAPDVMVVVAFRILPESIFSIPRLGAFNLHASLLPRYRGAAPIHWSLLNGDTETGVTTFFLKKSVDTGNILIQESIPISDQDNLATLYNSLRTLGSTVILKTLENISTGATEETSQDDSQASLAPKVSGDDQRLDFSQPAKQCHDRIRAFAPKPGAFCYRGGARLKIIRSSVSDIAGEIGSILAVENDCFSVGCGSESLKIYQLQPENKKSMDAGSYLRGYPLALGDTLD